MAYTYVLEKLILVYMQLHMDAQFHMCNWEPMPFILCEFVYGCAIAYVINRAIGSSNSLS
jgi:hypothetical protein